MKKLKLKSYVLPTLYLLITLGIFAGVVILGQDINLKEKDYDYSVGVFEEDKNTVPTVKEDEENNTSSNINTISAPVAASSNANIAVHFYQKDADNAKQEQSLIYYENTYLPNTGTLYAASDEYDVLAIFDGKVTDILDDEFFGKCVVVEHTSNLRSYYYGLDEITVEKGNQVSTGTKLGKSKNNEIMNDKKTFLLEIYYNNELMDPEEVIGTKITEF